MALGAGGEGRLCSRKDEVASLSVQTEQTEKWRCSAGRDVFQELMAPVTS